MGRPGLNSEEMTMKYDPETSMIEFTVQVPVDLVAVIAECHDNNEASETWVPLAALMHLLETYKVNIPVHRILDALMEHEDFDDAVESAQLLQRYEVAPRLELVPSGNRPG